jgi:uncharacterized membrane protein YeiH
MSLVTLFTVAGVAVFAASGALAAARKSLDPVGVLVLAIVTATGGGTLRDVLMDRHPIFWISTPWFIGVSAFAALVTWLWVKKFPPPDKALQYADALGLAFFSIAGVQIAQAGGLAPFAAAIMGAITGCAGGVIRDVLMAQVPLVLRQSELYVTACMAGIVIFLGLAALGVNAELASTFGMVVIAAVRLASIRWRIMLPVLQIGDR